jgi:3-phosphoshikimate 1-carboxyvinyltransferase
MTDSASKSQTDPRTHRSVPAGVRIAGRLRVPPSKSVTNRCLALALLARRPLRLDHPLDSEDTRRFAEALRSCGLTVSGLGSPSVEILPAGPLPDGADIDCGASGTMLRFLVAILTAVPGRWRLDGVPRLRERTVGPLAEALRRLGARIDFPQREGFAPAVIHGGSLGAGRTILDAGLSSQFLSALLMAALEAPGPVAVEVRSLTSGPYVDLTLEVIRAFGGEVERRGSTFVVRPSELRGGRYEVEGDYSAAGYPAAAAALTGGEVELEGLRRDSCQGDRRFLDLLERMGARVDWRVERREEPGGDGSREVVRVSAGRLRALEADLSALPDQVPTVAALAPFALGTTRITNVAHLRIKESDRLAAMACELRRAGARAEEEPDGLRIPGVWAETPPPDGPVVLSSHGDHRIAMSCALIGLRRPGVSIAAPDVVAKSYLGFWTDLDALTGG